MHYRNIFKGLSLLAGQLIFTSVQAATFAVNATVDAVDVAPGDGSCATAAAQCTLRAAIQEANATSGADVINLTAGTYLLTLSGTGENASATGDLDVTDSLTITGAGAAATLIDGGTLTGSLQDRVLHLTGDNAITVTLSDLTIQSGWLRADTNGGGGICIKCEGFQSNNNPALYDVTLSNVVVKDNFSLIAGAGIASFANVTIEDSEISGNRTPYLPGDTSGQNGSPPGAFAGGGMGGGIVNWGGEIVIRRSTISNNSAQTGGGLQTQQTSGVVPIFIIEDSRLTGNKAFLGGGVFNLSGDWNFGSRSVNRYGITFTGTTMDANVGELAGGAIYNVGLGSILLSNSTLSGNEAADPPGNPAFRNKGGGIYQSGGAIDIINSTIAGNNALALRLTDASSDNARGGDEIFLSTTNANLDPTQGLTFRFSVKNSIIGDATDAADNCNGTTGYTAFISSQGSNIDSGGTCSFTAQGDVAAPVPAALGLAPTLANNGGTTPTLALAANSIAVKKAANCPGGDQRGLQRDPANCDIGAYETTANQPVQTLVNMAPIATKDVVVAAPNTNTTINVLANDFDPDASGALTVQADFRTAKNGTVIAMNNGSLRYNPPQGGVVGQDSFNYTVSDSAGASAPSQVIIEVTANPTPIAYNQGISVPPGTELAGNLTANKSGNFVIVNQPVQGQLTITDAATGAFIYKANADAIGEDSFTFKLNDGAKESNIATVTISLDPKLQPEATSPTVSVAPGKIVNISLAANSNGAYTYSLVGTPAQGTILVFDGSKGLVSYQANANATGSDTFEFRVSDGSSSSFFASPQSVTNKVTVNIAAAGGNDAPSVSPIALTAAAGQAVAGKLTAADPNQDNILFVIDTFPKQGKITSFNKMTGEFTYLPAATAAGNDSFTFKAVDGVAESNVSPVTLAIQKASDSSPLAAPDEAITPMNTPTVIDVLKNDQYIDKSKLKIASVTPLTGNGATVTTNVDAAGTATLVYTPKTGFFGTDSFDYTIADEQGRGSTAIVTVTVQNPSVSTNPTPGTNSGPNNSNGGGNNTGGTAPGDNDSSNPPIQTEGGDTGGSGGGGGALTPGMLLVIALGYFRRQRRIGGRL